MICPFTVIVDTREQAGFTFEGLRADARDGRAPLTVNTIRRGIPSGDYSIDGEEHSIAIERKSKSDLFMSLGKERGRFKREIERLSVMRYTAVVVETDWGEILGNPPEFSRLSPKIVYRTVLAWQLQFPSVHWWMCPDRRFAEITTFRLLERYWKKLKGRLALDPDIVFDEMERYDRLKEELAILRRAENDI